MSRDEVMMSSTTLTWQKSWLRDYFESICIAVVFALFVRTFIVQAFKIPSSSMEQNLLVGDHILVNKFAYASHPEWAEGILPYRQLEREDVVVFKFPKEPARDFIKRVIGVGGDSLAIRDGTVHRGGRGAPMVPLDEAYTYIAPQRATFRELQRMDPLQVPEKQYFVMGDNRLNSEDSRFWGFVPQAYLKGKALLIYWSFDVPEEHKPTELNPDARLADKGLTWGYTLLHFFDRTRWSRTLRIIR